jgi:hypothetical protein
MASFPSSLQLPFHFEVEKLLADLRSAERYTWPMHYNSQDYQGSWTSLSLRSVNGEMDNVLAHTSATFQDTALLAECPYFREVMEGFHCPLTSVRLLRLEAGSVVLPHRDPGLSYAEGELRIHIPILTHDQVEFVVDGVALEMRAGECWYADFTKLHSVANRGTSPRVHLVLDGVRNEWTDDLFRSQGLDPALAVPGERDRKPAELKQMILAFENSGHPDLLLQAIELRRQLEGTA